MNTKHIYLMFFAAALLLAGCTADSQPEGTDVPETAGGDRVPVNFSVSDQVSLTRAATNIVSFNNGEAIKVFVKPAGADSYTAYTYTTAAAGQSNVSLTAPTPPPYFPAGAGTTVEAYAYYPAVTSSAFSVAANQTADASYKASDLMFASNRTITKGSAEGTNLAMSHLMAQLHLNITGQGVTVNRVLVSAKRSVTFAVSAAGVPSTTLTADAASDIVAATAAGHAYVCIPPQQINTVTVKVETGAEGDAATTATFSFTSTSDFVAGSSYTVNLTVSAAQLNTTVTLSDWDPGENADASIGINTGITPNTQNDTDNENIIL